MDLRSAALFIFLCCLALRGARSLKVQLTPDKARLVEGGELVMNCTVDTGGAMSFTWVKDDVRILQNALKYLNRVSLRHQTIGKKQESLLRIAKLTECDSGTYYCNVDRMGNIEKSKGTNVIVTRASQIASCQPINIIFIGVSAGVAAALVIALIIVSLRLRRTIKDCHGLQRQFIKYIAEKSTDFMITEEQKKHKPNQERRKKKNKSQQSNRVENMQRGNVL